MLLSFASPWVGQPRGNPLETIGNGKILELRVMKCHTREQKHSFSNTAPRGRQIWCPCSQQNNLVECVRKKMLNFFLLDL